MSFDQEEPAEDLFQFELNMEDGFVFYDCGYVARITDMWDQDGQWTRDWEEAQAVAWRPPGDYPSQFLLVIDLDAIETDQDEPVSH